MTTNNDCVQNYRFWHFINNLKKARNNNKIILTPQQRFALCNYMNGLPYNHNVLKEFIENPK